MDRHDSERAVAERIWMARRVAGETQVDAAKALGIRERTYARWEKAESFGFMRHLDAIAELFDTTTDALLGLDEGSPIEAQMEALRAELSEIRNLLLDPKRMKAVQDVLLEEEDVKRQKRRRKPKDDN